MTDRIAFRNRERGQQPEGRSVWVKCGEDRVAMDPATARHHPDAGGWTYDWRGGEWWVSGGDDGPDPARFDLARRVAARIDDFVRLADEYLAAFVAPERFGGIRPWDWIGTEFGRSPSDRVDVFEVQLTLDGDTYGLWGVRFMFAGPPFDAFHPFQFSRRQW